MTRTPQAPLSPRTRPQSPLCQSDIQIGQASALSGVSAKMIRYYESIGLVQPAVRSEGNYRTYNRDAVQTLRFVARARDLGFSMEEIETLLSLWLQPNRSSAEVKTVALGHMAVLDEKIGMLQAMRATLKHLTDHCHGDDRPACPILDELAGDGLAVPKTPHARARHRG